MDALIDGREWVEDRDRARIQFAFRELAKTCDSWPAPVHLLRAMPIVREQLTLPKPVDPEVARQNLAKIGEMLREAGILK